MKLKIEFVLKETGECEIFETTLDKNVKVHDFVYFKNELNGSEYTYVLGSFKIWRPKHNVICAEEVELLNLKIEYDFA